MTENWMLGIYRQICCWPFELPTTPRRAFLICFPVTVPVWLGGVVLASPLLFVGLLTEMVSDMWAGRI